MIRSLACCQVSKMKGDVDASTDEVCLTYRAIQVYCTLDHLVDFLIDYCDDVIYVVLLLILEMIDVLINGHTSVLQGKELIATSDAP